MSNYKETNIFDNKEFTITITDKRESQTELIFKEFFKLLDKKGWHGWFIDFSKIKNEFLASKNDRIDKTIKTEGLARGYSYPFKDKSIGLHDGVHRPIYDKNETFIKSKQLKRR